MHNNETTYHDKWNTPQNKAALNKLDKKYFDKSHCSPHCPLSWAPEVLELFETIERELGIRWNESTIRAYPVTGNLYGWFVKGPILTAITSFRYHFIDKKSEYYNQTSFVKTLGKVVYSFFNKFAYGNKAFSVIYVAPLINKVRKGKFTLSQVKEKFGSLRIYFDCPAAFEEWVEREIRKCELKLAIKGAYAPIETFWDAGISRCAGTKHSPDTIKTEVIALKDGSSSISVDETTYRGIMKELGLDLKDIENKAIIRKANKVDQF